MKPERMKLWTLHLRPSLLVAVRRRARAEGVTASEIVRRAIAAYVAPVVGPREFKDGGR